jgi:hypothetical protein
MKKRILYFLLLLILFSCSKDELDEPYVEIIQGHCIPFYISDTYNYPTLPGTDEWKELGSLAEKVEVCQIPKKKLETISTEGLLETLLHYPLILDYIFFDNMQNGFNRIKNENNGFPELYSRKNIFEIITVRYELMTLDCGENLYPPFVSGEPAPIQISLMTFEFFIFQDEFLNNLNKNQQHQIFEIVYEKHQNKKVHDFDNYSKLVSSAIMGKIMFKNDFLPFVEICDEIDFMNFFIDKIPMYRPANISPIEIIEEYANEFKASR